MKATYTVELYDPEEDGFACWSGRLASEVLQGPNEGLSWRAIGRAIRLLRAAGWDDRRMYVSRDEEPPALAPIASPALPLKGFDRHARIAPDPSGERLDHGPRPR